MNPEDIFTDSITMNAVDPPHIAMYVDNIGKTLPVKADKYQADYKIKSVSVVTGEVRLEKVGEVEVIPTKKDEYDAFICLDCGLNTLFEHEYYMLRDDVWRSIHEENGMLCIGCAEERLGRELTRADFIDCPLNDDIAKQSKRLQNRLKK